MAAIWYAMPPGGYLALRLRTLWLSRGPVGFLHFALSRVVRKTRDLVFERDLDADGADAPAPPVGRFVDIDNRKLDERAFAPLLDQVLRGEGEIYGIGLRRNDRLFLVADDGGRVLHYSFVQFESRYKTLLGEDGAVPMFTRCWTSPAARGKRLYPSTLRHGSAALARDGFCRVLITCDPTNTASVRGIEHAGFRLVRRISSMIFLSRLALQRISGPNGNVRWRLVRLVVATRGVTRPD